MGGRGRVGKLHKFLGKGTGRRGRWKERELGKEIGGEGTGDREEGRGKERELGAGRRGGGRRGI